MDLLGPVPSCAGALVRSGTGVVEENNARVDREKRTKGRCGRVFCAVGNRSWCRLDASILRSKRINDHPAVNRTSLEKAS